jgi:hypothetical protein
MGTFCECSQSLETQEMVFIDEPLSMRLRRIGWRVRVRVGQSKIRTGLRVSVDSFPGGAKLVVLVDGIDVLENFALRNSIKERILRMKTVEEIIRELPPAERQEVRRFVRSLVKKHTVKHIEPRFQWAGVLKNLRGEYTSVELQHKISQHRIGSQ